MNEPTDWVGYSLDGAANVTLTGYTTLKNLGLGSHGLIVYANDTSGNMGSRFVSFNVKKIYPPIPPNYPPNPVTLHDPTDITKTSMSLSWTKNEDSDFKKYVLYHSTSEGSIGQKVTETTDSSDTSYQMTGLSEDTTYYYVVRVVDTRSLSSDSNGRLTKIEIRFCSSRKAVTNAPFFRYLSPSTATGSLMPQCAVMGWPGQIGQASVAALSQTVKTKSMCGASGSENSRQSLLRNPSVL